MFYRYLYTVYISAICWCKLFTDRHQGPTVGRQWSVSCDVLLSRLGLQSISQ